MTSLVRFSFLEFRIHYCDINGRITLVFLEIEMTSLVGFSFSEFKQTIVTSLMGFSFFRVYNRFCEIQDIPTKKSTMTYDELRSIVAKYADLCKCTELKVNYVTF